MRAAFTSGKLCPWVLSYSTYTCQIQSRLLVLDGGYKLEHKLRGFIKASTGDEIELECIANYLTGVVLFLFTAAYWSLLEKSPKPGPACHPLHQGSFISVLREAVRLMNPADWWSRSRDWFTLHSPAQPFHPDQATLPHLPYSSITQ